MEPGLVRDVLTAVVGVGTGVLSSAFGVGGAVVSTPAIRALGVGPLLAVGTTLPSIIPSAVAGTLRYRREGLVLWRVVALTAPAGVAAAVGGSILSRAVPGEGHLLMLLTAVLLGYTALHLARAPGDGGRADDDAGGWRAAPATLVGIGVGAGLLSGLLGVGGGLVMVPAFAGLARLPLKQTIATSLACVALFAVPGTIAHSLQGGVDWRVASLLTVGVVPGARLGAAAALRASDAHLRRVVAAGLAAIAGIYFAGELVGLLSR